MSFPTKQTLAACLLLSPMALHGQQNVQAAMDLNRAVQEGQSAYNAKDYAKAIPSLKTIAEAKPEPNPQLLQSVLYQLGFAQYFQLQEQDAVATFETLLQKFPQTKDAPEVHYMLGKLLVKQDGKIDDAIKHIEEAARNPEYTDEARFMAAEAYIKKDDTDKASELLKSAMKAKSSGPTMLRAAIQLIDLFIAKEKLKEAIDVMQRLTQSSGYPDVIVAINYRLLQIGDRQLQAKSYSDALKSYSLLRPRNQVIEIQTARLEQMRGSIAAMKKAIEQNAKLPISKLPKGAEDKLLMMEAMLANNEKVMEELKGVADYDASLQYRIARCFFNMERYWQASVGFETMVEEYAKNPDAPNALFGAIICQWRLVRLEQAGKLCLRYLERYPTGPHVSEVSELHATLLMQQNRNDECAKFLEAQVKANPKAANRESLLFLLANSYFQSEKYNEAATSYDTLSSEFASSANMEEFVYRRALCDFLRNDYKATIAGFDAYEKKYPAGTFSSDVQYRRGIILLALKEYDKLIESMQNLLRSQNAAGFKGQIYTLLGDAYAAPDNTKANFDLAADNYANAVKFANNDQTVLSYSLEQANNLYRSNRRFNELEALWADFLKNNPNHAMSLRAVGELSKLLIRNGKKEEGKKLMIETALKDIHNPNSEYVEMLLSQIAAQFAPPRAKVKDKAPQPTTDPEADLNAALAIPEEAKTPVYLARMLFARSELARLMRDSEKYSLRLKSLVASTAPTDLGPVLLALVGQRLYDDKKYDQAVPFFKRLRDTYPNSQFSDAAPVGLGRIALQKKEYNNALKDFEFAINKAAGTSMLKEATFGKAQALFYLNRKDEAKALFEQIITAKEWRGEEKAGSLFFRAQIAEKENENGIAHSYYQRIYLSHGAFPKYAAPAYIRAAELLEKDGKNEDAKLTYRLLLKKEAFKETPEYEIARERAGNAE